MMAHAPVTGSSSIPHAPRGRGAARRTQPSAAGEVPEIGELITELYETAAAVRERGELVARSVGQTQARWQVLFTLAGGPLAVPAMARRLGLTRQSVQRVVSLLVADGLAGSLPNPVHRRSPLFELTPDGSRTLREINTAARDWHCAVAGDLDAADRERLRGMLAALRAQARSRDGRTARSGRVPLRARGPAAAAPRRSTRPTGGR